MSADQRCCNNGESVDDNKGSEWAGGLLWKENHPREGRSHTEEPMRKTVKRPKIPGDPDGKTD